MTLTIRKRPPRSHSQKGGKDAGTIMVVGPRDAAMATLLGKASPYQHPRVEFQRAPEALLKQQVTLTGVIRPWLYVFNTAKPWDTRPRRKGVKRRAQASQKMAPEQAPASGGWIDVLRWLQQVQPATPVLVVADDRESSSWDALLEAGADELITLIELKSAAVVKRRIESALAHARADSAPQSGVIELDTPLTTVEIAEGRAKVRAAVKARPRAGDRPGLLSDLLTITVPDLRGLDGRLDAKRIAARLGVSLNALAAAMPLSRETLRTNPTSQRLQGALDPFARVLAALDTLLAGEGGRQWLNTRHHKFNATPLEAMLSGDAETVARLLELTREGDVD